jgi:hypothetical protein
MNYWAARQLSKAIDKLGGELRESIETSSESIQKSFEDFLTQQITAIRDSSERSNEALEQIRTHVAELLIPANERAEAKTYRRKAHRQQVWLTWVLGLPSLLPLFMQESLQNKS